MAISRKNWEKSKKLYTLLIEGMEAKDRCLITMAMVNDCGYCAETNAVCYVCIFKSEQEIDGNMCAAEDGGYFVMMDYIKLGYYEEALPIARRILQRILNDEPNVYDE
jgi:hypothetical protein